MLIREAIVKFFPELVAPDLVRKTSKKHWRKTRKQTTKEKAVAVLMQSKEAVIQRKIIHGQESVPILDISDDDLSVCVNREYATVNIDISYEDLVAYDVEITGDSSDRELMDLIENMLSQVEWKGRVIYV